MIKKQIQQIRIVPLGGMEEVGRNMTVFEYGSDIVILDMGLQFPEEEMLGIDYIIPDTRYLEGKEKNIRGVILSHGHLDHIGAVPHLLPKLGWPFVYASRLTLALVRRRLEEAGFLKFLKAKEIKSADEKISFGNIKVSFFPSTHSIMDSLGVVIQTPVANIIHPGDWKYDLNPVHGEITNFSSLAKWNRPNTPSILMAEALGSTKEGHQISEREIYNNIKQIIEKAEGRVIIATFASMVERVSWIVKIAEELKKKVAFDGYSMKINMGLAKELGYAEFDESAMIDVKKIDDYQDNKVIVVCTGAQGEDRAVLMRIANGEHRHLQLKKKDTIIFSSSVIPGNERSVQRVKDNLYRKCDNVVHKEIMDVHGGGHGLIEDIKRLIKEIRPKYFIPVYANHYLLREAAKIAVSLGFPLQNIFIPDNGSVIEATARGIKFAEKRIPIEYVFVDGLGVGDIKEVVLRDRQMLAKDGIFVLIATVDSQTGKVKGSPDIISRGFVYLRESQELLKDVRHIIRKTIEDATAKMHPINIAYVKEVLRDQIGKFLFQKTQRRPMVLPVIIEV
jgi:ribonuclease J